MFPHDLSNCDVRLRNLRVALLPTQRANPDALHPTLHHLLHRPAAGPCACAVDDCPTTLFDTPASRGPVDRQFPRCQCGTVRRPYASGLLVQHSEKLLPGRLLERHGIEPQQWPRQLPHFIDERRHRLRHIGRRIDQQMPRPTPIVPGQRTDPNETRDPASTSGSAATSCPLCSTASATNFACGANCSSHSQSVLLGRSAMIQRSVPTNRPTVWQWLAMRRPIRSGLLEQRPSNSFLCVFCREAMRADKASDTLGDASGLTIQTWHTPRRSAGIVAAGAD